MRQQSAFTLVELSIVLVILGLLVGGVLTGQALIRAAELRSVFTQFTGFKTALYSFRDKYNALPGDMPNAVRYWGAAAGTTNDGQDGTCEGLSTASTDKTTCNGDGNGVIGDVSTTELFRAWQHLANAGLVEGSFTAVAGPDNAAIIGQNVPRSRLANAGWAFNNSYSSQPLFVNALSLGGYSDYQLLDNPIITGADAMNIDAKLDDGKPHSGAVEAPPIASDCSSATDYLVSAFTKGCWLLFSTQ